jgi:hypothetical protein
VSLTTGTSESGLGCQDPAQKALVAQKRGPVEQILAVMNLSIFNENYELLTVIIQKVEMFNSLNELH